MARATREKVERLEREVSLERLVQDRGVQLRESGGQLVGTCPFHDEREAPFTVNRAANTWSCSACSPEPQSVIAWTMKADGVSRRLAIQLLSEDADSSGQTLGARKGRQTGAVPKRSTVQRLPTVVANNADDSVLLGQVIDYYREVLKQSPEALDSLQARGLRSPEMIEHFRLGFANRT